VSGVEASEQNGTRNANRDPVPAGIMVFGLYLVGLSIFAVLAPGTFYDELGRFGPRNDHYTRQLSWRGSCGAPAVPSLCDQVTPPHCYQPHLTTTIRRSPDLRRVL
jgi:hypothetical protein